MQFSVIKAMEKRRGEVNCINELTCRGHIILAIMGKLLHITNIVKLLQNVTKIPPSTTHRKHKEHTHCCSTQCTHFVTQKVIIHLVD